MERSRQTAHSREKTNVFQKYMKDKKNVNQPNGMVFYILQPGNIIFSLFKKQLTLNV